jgi:tetratricopeptide (TPR) repeat protein
MDSTDKKAKEDDNVIIIRKEWDYSPHIEKGEMINYHITRKKESRLLVDFLSRNEEGALLLCGKRGVGKTSAIFSAIHIAKQRVERQGKTEGKTKTTILPVLVNAPNFESRKESREEDDKNRQLNITKFLHQAPIEQKQRSDDFDFLQFKRVVLQNLVRRLFQTAIKYNMIEAPDPLLMQRQIDKKMQRSLLGQYKLTELLQKIKRKLLLKHMKKGMNSELQKDTKEDEKLPIIPGEVKKKIIDLYRRAVAKEIIRESNLQELDYKKRLQQREVMIGLQATKELIITIIISFLAAIGVALNPPPVSWGLPNDILPVLISIIPPAVKSISMELKYTSIKERAEETKDSLYYRYDYEVSTLQSELEETLQLLSKNHVKVIFVVDELDKVYETDVINVIKSLKTLFNQTSTLFVVIAGEEFFRKMLERSKDRGKEYTLFSQKIFLQRPNFDEIRKFMEQIVEPNVEQSIGFLFSSDQIPKGGNERIRAFLEKGKLNKEIYNESIQAIEPGIVEKLNEDNNKTIIKITVGKNFLSLPFDDEEEESSDTNLIIKDQPGDKKTIEFIIRRNNKRELCVYLKNPQFKRFQYYACYLSKTDFFDLYNVLRDRIAPYKGSSRLPHLDIKLGEKELIKANLQEALEWIYPKKEHTNTSDWYKNDRLLSLMYGLLTKLAERKADTTKVRIKNEPEFSVVFVNQNGVVVDVLQDIDDENEKDALTVLIHYLARLDFLGYTDIDNEFLVKGTLKKVLPPTNIYTKEEKAFIDEYIKFEYVVTSYTDLYIKYGGKKIGDVTSFNHDNFIEKRDDIFADDDIRKIITSPILDSNIDGFNRMYGDLISEDITTFYDPRIVDENTKNLTSARNIALTNFILLVNSVVRNIAKYRNAQFPIELLTVQDLEQKLNVQLPSVKKVSSSDTVAQPILFIESIPAKRERRQLLIFQNISEEVTKEIRSKKDADTNFYALILKTASDIHKDILDKFTKISGGSLIKEDLVNKTAAGFGNSAERRIIDMEIPKDENSFADVMECIESWMKEAEALKDKHPDDWINDAEYLATQMKYDEALKSYNKALELDRKYDKTWYEKGELLVKLERYQEAIDCFNQVLEIDPRHSNAWYSKGRVFYELRRYQEAIDCFNNATAIARDYKEAWYYQGLSLLQLERYQEAIDCFNNAKVTAPNYKEALYYQGIAFDNLRRYKEAKICYDRAIEIDPEYTDALYSKGLTLSNLKEYEEAIRYFDKAARLNPTYLADVLYFRAGTKAKKGDLNDSLADLKRAIEIGGETYIELAKQDDNFVKLKDNERFKILIGEITSETGAPLTVAVGDTVTVDVDKSGRYITTDISTIIKEVNSYGLNLLPPNFFEIHKSTKEDFEDWKRGFVFRMESIQEQKHFRRPNVFNDIKDRLKNNHRILLLGESGSSKTTLLMEIMVDYFNRGYIVLYNFGESNIENIQGLVQLIQRLIRGGNKVIVAVDNVQNEGTIPIFQVMDMLSPSNYRPGENNILFVLTARIPDFDSFVASSKSRNTQREYQESLAKIDQDDKLFRYAIPPFTEEEIVEFIKKYGSSTTSYDDLSSESLKERAKEIYKTTKGNPMIVKFFVLGKGLQADIENRFNRYLRDKPRKMNTMLVCSLLSLSDVKITDDILRAMKILEPAYDLNRATLYYNKPEGVWTTIHPQWDMELLYFLYNESNDRKTNYERKKMLEGALKLIVSLEDKEMTTKVLKKIFDIAAERKIPVDTVDSAVQIPDNLDSMKQSEIHDAMGNAYIKLQRYEKAIVSYDKAIALEPNNANAYRYKGEALYYFFKYEEAIKCFDRALELEPNNANIWNNKGLALDSLGNYEGAINCYDKAIELEPNDANIWNNKGAALDNLSKYEEAIKFYDKALELEPNDANIWNNKGLALDSLGKYKEAIKLYDKAIELEPNNAYAWNNKGYALRHLNRNEEAIKLYDKAIELEPNYALAWYNKGNALRHLDRNEEAINCYDKAIELNPNYAYPWNNKGIALYNLGKHEEAIKFYDKAIELEPNNANIWNNKGNALDSLGKHEEAIKLYDKAIELEPNNAVPWYNKGNALDSLGKYKEAIKLYDKALELEPNYALAWNNKGYALRNLGKYEEAIACYDKGLELNPNDAYAWNNKGDALRHLDRNEEAINCYDKAIELNPNYALAWLIKGLSLHSLGKYEEAIKSYDKALEIDPNDAAAWYYRAGSKVKKGDTENGLADLKKAIEIDKNNIESAKQDEDFKDIRKDERFKALIMK